MIPKTRQIRYTNQPIAVRLGGLAADIARIASIAQIPVATAVDSLLKESRAFAEWSAPALLPDRVEDAARLVDIQRGLTHWLWIWNDAQKDPIARAQLAKQAQQWSDEVLAMSGLLDAE